MAQSTRDIKRRIKSISSTRKITRALEMVSAAKMRRAVESTLASRNYALAAWDILTNISTTTDSNLHTLFSARPVANILIVLVTTNKGMCGGVNVQLIKKVVDQIKNPERLARANGKHVSVDTDKIKISFVTVGKKGEEIVKRLSYEIVASFSDLPEKFTAKDIKSIADLAIVDYASEKFDKVLIAYTDFVSVISQKPKLRQLLPLSKVDLEKTIAETQSGRLMEDSDKEKKMEQVKITEYLFEPTPEVVLDKLVNRLIEMQIYQALLESRASEHSARMMAMRNASDAAGEMIDDLTLTYNQARQANITRELIEIVSGASAL